MSSDSQPFEAWGIELPPVGTVCLIDTSDFDHSTCDAEVKRIFEKYHDAEVLILGHDPVDGVALFRTNDDSRLGRTYHAFVASVFKAPKSERQKTIEALTDHLDQRQLVHPGISMKAAEIAYDFIVKRLGKYGVQS